MTLAKFTDFFTPSPSCPHLGQIFTQPPILRQLFHDLPPPSDADIIYLEVP